MIQTSCCKTKLTPLLNRNSKNLNTYVSAFVWFYGFCLQTMKKQNIAGGSAGFLLVSDQNTFVLKRGLNAPPAAA